MNLTAVTTAVVLSLRNDWSHHDKLWTAEFLWFKRLLRGGTRWSIQPIKSSSAHNPMAVA